MFDSYECELKTDAPYFAQWFWMTLLDCAPLEMDVDLGRGKAELEGPGNHSDYVMNVKWKLVTHEYLNYGDEQELLPRIIEYRRRHLELLRVCMPKIGFRAKPAAPGRLQVSLWVSGLDDELQGAWDCLIGEIKKTYSLTTPAAQPSSGAGVIRAHELVGELKAQIQAIADGEGTAKRKLKEIDAVLVGLGVRLRAEDVADMLQVEKTTIDQYRKP